jgi:hypothetical protein
MCKLKRKLSEKEKVKYGKNYLRQKSAKKILCQPYLISLLDAFKKENHSYRQDKWCKRTGRIYDP